MIGWFVVSLRVVRSNDGWLVGRRCSVVGMSPPPPVVCSVVFEWEQPEPTESGDRPLIVKAGGGYGAGAGAGAGGGAGGGDLLTVLDAQELTAEWYTAWSARAIGADLEPSVDRTWFGIRISELPPTIEFSAMISVGCDECIASGAGTDWTTAIQHTRQRVCADDRHATQFRFTHVFGASGERAICDSNVWDNEWNNFDPAPVRYSETDRSARESRSDRFRCFASAAGGWNNRSGV